MSDLDDLMAAFAGVNVDDHDELVETFARVLGTDGSSARFFLEASQWNLEVALGNFLDTVGSRSNLARAGSVPRSIFKGDETVQQIGAQAFPPGQPVDMYWQFLNSGEAPWPMDAALVHTEGDPMGVQMEASVAGCAPNAEANVHLRIVAPASGGTAAGCFRLRHSGGFFGEPIWLVVNSDPALPPYAGDAGAGAAAATLEQQQQQQQQQMMTLQQQQEMMAAQQQQGMFGQVQPEGMAGAAADAAGPSGRLFQQAAAGAGLGAPTAGAAPAGGMTLDEDDMDL